MGLHVQLDLKAIEQASLVARAAGISRGDQLSGLVDLYHHVWTKKTDRATPELLMGCFGVARSQLERLVEAEVSFGHLAPAGAEWRIRGAKRYFRLRAKLSEGGKKSAGNLKQNQHPPASTSSSQSGPAAPSTPAPKARTLSAQEQCWDYLDHLRIAHCVAAGVAPGEHPRPKFCNKKLNDVCTDVGIVDRILDGGESFTRWDYLAVLFQLYLEQDRIGVKDERGNPCAPPWPIPLFLSPGVLGRFKEQEEQAA